MECLTEIAVGACDSFRWRCMPKIFQTAERIVKQVRSQADGMWRVRRWACDARSREAARSTVYRGPLFRLLRTSYTTWLLRL
ncbi:hypothetical protein ACRALDRAFT_1060191 [Sodiomyces alcalophilus JCM 7366]|uniref:uncharacterized protein n=1 Tax=Sodiomyces alcalophilus JCM 7366 TaxID=591952 RepID=UPI0039B63FEC